MATPAHSLEIWPQIVAGAVAQVTSWQDHANCSGVDQDLFFPQRGASTRKAKAICEACEVKAECLEFAITQGERIIGIWGERHTVWWRIKGAAYVGILGALMRLEGVEDFAGSQLFQTDRV